MLNRFLTYLKYGNSFCGIEHSYNEHNDIIYVSLLKHNKNELELENNFSSKSVEEISKKLKKNQHAYLILNNSQVLSKKINSENKTIQNCTILKRCIHPLSKERDNCMGSITKEHCFVLTMPRITINCG